MGSIRKRKLKSAAERERENVAMKAKIDEGRRWLASEKNYLSHFSFTPLSTSIPYIFCSSCYLKNMFKSTLLMQGSTTPVFPLYGTNFFAHCSSMV